MKRLLLFAAVTAILSLGIGHPDQPVLGTAKNSPPHNTSALIKTQAATSNYVLVAWGELGMHCIDGKDYSVFSVLPPYNVIHAQLFKKAEPPAAVTSGVTITYLAAADATGSVNTSSANKTNFWTWLNALFHATLPPETGLAGYKTQGKVAQQMSFNAAAGYWEARRAAARRCGRGSRRRCFALRPRSIFRCREAC